MSGAVMSLAIMAAKIGTVIGTGIGVATVFQFFHDTDFKRKKKEINKEEGDVNGHIEHLRKRASTSR